MHGPSLHSRFLDDTHAALEHRRHAEKLAVQYLDDVIDQAS